MSAQFMPPTAAIRVLIIVNAQMVVLAAKQLHAQAVAALAPARSVVIQSHHLNKLKQAFNHYRV
jgi:hypothetical protein